MNYPPLLFSLNLLCLYVCFETAILHRCRLLFRCVASSGCCGVSRLFSFFPRRPLYLSSFFFFLYFFGLCFPFSVFSLFLMVRLKIYALLHNSFTFISYFKVILYWLGVGYVVSC
ncbi:hypothetical protein BDZ91DRAFT_745601 [Kalaharituber pfeilii]|nr:hypothetical protein BDZ91DRAFT_745601 [Kalaharituber pfeilii]